MELLIILAVFVVVTVLAVLGLGVDSRDNENWNPGQVARGR